jgi:hypothetical protein
MDLKQLSENISCSHIKFLNKKYDTYNSYLYTNRLICNSINSASHISDNKEDLTLLKSYSISKKSCIFKPPVVINNMDYLNTTNTIPTMFNMNTKIKTIL